MFGFFEEDGQTGDMQAVIAKAMAIGRSWHSRVMQNEEVAHELGNRIFTTVNELIESEFDGKDGFDRAVFLNGLFQAIAKLILDDITAIARLNAYDDDNQEVSDPKIELAAAMAFVQLVSSHILSDVVTKNLKTKETKELDASEIVAQVEQLFGGPAEN